MSSILEYLNGKKSYVLYSSYGEKIGAGYEEKYVCLIRFWADGWSTVVHATGHHQYIAGARALRHYVEFCNSVGLVFDFEEEAELPSVITNTQMLVWLKNDQAFCNSFFE